MSKRTSDGHPTLELVLRGDDAIAAVLAEALSAQGPVERHTHGFHTYPAGLHPDAARALIKLLPEGKVLDPFMGGGTVLVEAVLAGRTAIGRDVSPTALRAARLRSAVLDEALLTRIRSRARKLAEIARKERIELPDQLHQVLSPWYDPEALYELTSLREGIAESDDDIRRYLAGLFSSILIKTSWRRSDTSAQKEKHRRPPGTTSVLFHKRARQWGRMVASLREEVPEGTPPVDIGMCDARKIDFAEGIAGIVTSPPYPATYDYVKLQHLRNVWFEDDSRDAQRKELGSRRLWRDGGRDAVKTWRADTYAWQDRAAKALKPGGRLCVVIGDGLTPGGLVDTRQPTTEGAAKAGLKLVASASLDRPDHARDTSRWEHVFLFEKPGK